LSNENSHVKLGREKITFQNGQSHDWLCICGNTSDQYSFYPCKRKGELIDADLESDEALAQWVNLWRCEKCHSIIEQQTGKVIQIGLLDLIEDYENRQKQLPPDPVVG
jgi:hypothetical protein